MLSFLQPGSFLMDHGILLHQDAVEQNGGTSVFGDFALPVTLGSVVDDVVGLPLGGFARGVDEEAA